MSRKKGGRRRLTFSQMVFVGIAVLVIISFILSMVATF